MNEYFLFSLLTVVAAMMSYINTKFLKLPKAIGLTVLSITFSALCASFLSKDNFLVVALSSFDFKTTVLDGMLSFLLFANALHFNMIDLKKELKAIFGLASVGLFLSAGSTALLIYGFCKLVGVELSFGYCLVFGALISPTDPIAVISTLAGNKTIPKHLKTRVVGESLFNDATGIVLFVVLSNIVFFGSGGDFGNAISVSNFDFIWTISKQITIEAGGGILLGYIFAKTALIFLNTNEDSETSIFLTLGIASMGYVIAHSLHVSGPISMVVAGLFIGNSLSDRKNVNPEQVRKLDNFWMVIDNMLNSFLFILIGLELTSIPFNINAFWIGVAGIFIVTISRFISVSIPITLIDKKLSHSSTKDNVLVAWSGVRGGISLALALSLPDEGNMIVGITYTVVVLSILLQGSTLKLVLNWIYPPKIIKKAANDEAC
ncbi:cation:proton antiporter [Francisella adeliensis]|uniref:Sodium:proton antiporter n=1 Tax=Francisella adeliensis TaxID=2007306 RepID=A0A2Z4XY29_9GAMM|nr:sodium:proton antiporter [Francisella adeliensis]AXA33576.1 sodium:proton antiporter [Francisella adeliensis]MBK2084716.1 sodium:proton antiporter [Francisella adeliensis]MBK2097341.1 sodium:proton antiporter [Francisella adeliensis]QIW11808.1 sodium:proton antiporter [Francisella adeliensis]QIW13684.1 sodium:proton antiporter [Francisella adeliensis]